MKTQNPPANDHGGAGTCHQRPQTDSVRVIKASPKTAVVFQRVHIFHSIHEWYIYRSMNG